MDPGATPAGGSPFVAAFVGGAAGEDVGPDAPSYEARYHGRRVPADWQVRLRSLGRCVLSRIMWSEEYERRAAEMRQRNERDRLASRLGHEHLRIAELTARTGAVERHYTVKEIAALWKLSTKSITRLFRGEPGILKIGRDQPRRGRRVYTTLRIPESVIQRVYRRPVVR